MPWYLWNSAKVAVLATAMTLLLGVPAAFLNSTQDADAARATP